jgi:AcrR family transcriptional regulator
MSRQAAAVATIRRGRREPLSRDRITAAALTFIDRWGLEELSTRRLGRQLGVEGMALYKHFKNRDEILDAVAEALILELEVPPEGKWAQRLKDFARRYRALGRVHPRAYPLLATRQLATPRALHLVEEIVKALVESGFSPDEAALVFRTVGNFCNGTALDELAIMRRIAGEPLERGDKGSHLASLDRAMHPSHFDAQFEAGLSILVDGFERMHSANRGKTRR